MYAHMHTIHQEPSPNGRVFRKWCNLLVDFDDSPLNISRHQFKKKKNKKRKRKRRKKTVP